MTDCRFPWLSKSIHPSEPVRATAWEDELTSVLAAAELAFEQLSRRCPDRPAL